MNSSCPANDGAFDFEKLCLLADGIRPLLGSRLENRIHSGLEEFVCKPSSRYSRRFPRVRRCLDVVAAWLNYLDAFRAKDIEQETIKHTIEYLLKDGRVTHFEDPLVPNTRLNRVDPDSLTEQNDMKSMNVWRFIKEKDYWLCQDQAQPTSTICMSPPRIDSQSQDCRKDSCSSDLNVEVGSSTKERLIDERYVTIKFCCDRKVGNLRSPKPKIQYDHKFTSCSKQNILNPSKRTLTTINEPKLPPIKRNLPIPQRSIQIQSGYGEKSDKSTCIRSPKLKVVVRKATSAKCRTLWEPPKVTNISIPCKSSHLIVRLFEADPSLSDSCLILIKRKFEHAVQNACSIINDIFKEIDRSTIRCLYLNCRICPGRIDMNLERDDTMPRTRLFLARVPICLNVHKRESSCRNVASSTNQGERSQGPNEGPSVLMEKISFYSQCSSHNLLEERRMPSKDNAGKEWGKEVKFVWSRKEQREVDFELPSCFAKSQADENFQENCVEIAGEIDEEEEEIRGDEKNDTCVNASIAEDDDQRKLDHAICRGSTNILGGGHTSKQDDSTAKSCSPEECLHLVPCSNNDNTELNTFEEKEKTTSREEYSSQPQSNVNRKNDGLVTFKETEKSTIESKGGTQRVQDTSKLEINIVAISSDSQIQEALITTETKKNISETDNSYRVKESFNESYVRSTVSKISKLSYDSRCSCCGKDLSNEEIRNFANCVQPDNSNIETHGTLNSMSTKDLTVKEPTKTPSISVTIRSVKSKMFVLESENLARNDDNVDYVHEKKFTKEDPESCKCTNNLNSPSGYRTSRKQCHRESNSSMETDSVLDKNYVESKFCRKPYCSSSSNKSRCKSREDTGFRFFSRRKNSFWRGSIVPGNLCSSFPALDRIKYLIRKKLRRLLLEERDRGTSTSKTYLRNERYLVSISSGKLNEGRICSSIRCPFTTRNRVEAQGPQRTFAEGTLPKKENKDETFEECVGARCRRRIRENELFRKIRLAEISRFWGQKGGSRVDDRRKIDERDEGHPFHREGRRSSITSFGSTRVIFFEDDIDRFSSERTRRKESYERGRGLKTGKLSKDIFREEIASPNFVIRRNRRGFLRVSLDKNRGGRERGDTLPDRRSRSFKKRLLKCWKADDYDEDNDFMNLLCSYEKRISDLDADFRLKLLQYVALCRSVKDLLMKRLPRPDDV